MNSTRAVFLAVGFALVCAQAARADTASAPDSARINLLRFALANFDEVKVIQDSASVVGHGAVLSTEGLRFGSIYSHHSIASENRPQERLVPWAEIESIHVRRGSSGVGILAGLGCGFLIGGIIATSDNVNDGSALAWGLLSGMTLGWLIDHPGRWQAVYP